MREDCNYWGNFLFLGIKCNIFFLKICILEKKIVIEIFVDGIISKLKRNIIVFWYGIVYFVY